MINLLIGHRGCGKSALLKRIKTYAQSSGTSILAFDLDEEVSCREGLSIDEIFESQGEEAFRRLENKTLQALIEPVGNEDLWISLGAGFQGDFPKGSKTWWIRRPSDQIGRIFLDRPRLNPELSPLDEFFARATFREKRFRDWADHQVILSEGFQVPTDFEAMLMGFKPVEAKGYVTLVPEGLDQRRLVSTVKRLSSFRPRGIELRDDLLSDAILGEISDHLDPSMALFSLRKFRVVPHPWRQARVDWALELGTPPVSVETFVVSQHQRGDDLAALLRSVPRTANILKLAIPIANFSELQRGHDWFLEEPGKRAFLPMSRDGRWSWYRSLFGQQQALGFWREGEGSAPDQPTLGEWLRLAGKWSQFAAVVGYPVGHSWTPAEHTNFFAPKEIPVVAIPMREEECTKVTLQCLQSMGLIAAAVTSPLKLKAMDLADETSSTANELGSLNTLGWDAHFGIWRGENTDLFGAKKLIDSQKLNGCRFHQSSGQEERPYHRLDQKHGERPQCHRQRGLRQ